MSAPKEAAPKNADLFGGWFYDNPSASRVMENQGWNGGGASLACEKVLG